MTSLLSSQKRESNLVTEAGVIPCALQAGKDLRLPGKDRQGPNRASEDLLGAEKVKSGASIHLPSCLWVHRQ
jgi:hypothetical protein